MKYLFSILALSGILLFSCENSSNEQAEKQLKMEADSLLKELMNAHDEVMPQTLVLENLKKKMLSKMDSIEVDSTAMEEIGMTINTMDTAIIGMREWMSAFERPSDTTSLKNVVEYYRSEIDKMTKVKDVTFEILPKAKTQLSELDSL